MDGSDVNETIELVYPQQISWNCRIFNCRMAWVGLQYIIKRWMDGLQTTTSGSHFLHQALLWGTAIYLLFIRAGSDNLLPTGSLALNFQIHGLAWMGGHKEHCYEPSQPICLFCLYFSVITPPACLYHYPLTDPLTFMPQHNKIFNAKTYWLIAFLFQS